MVAWTEEARRLLKLAGPMMVAQGGLMTMGLVDTLLVGRVSVLDMGGVSLGNNLCAVVLVLGLGLLMGLEPLISQAHGAGETARTRSLFGQGLWLALLATLPLTLLLGAALLVLEPAGVGEQLRSVTGLYILARLPGVPFNLLYGACRAYLTSVERVRPVLAAVIVANVFNAGADALLLFVYEWGAVGVGIATSASWILMFGLLLWAARDAEPKRPRERPDLKAMLQISKLGLPIGLQLGVEVGIFALVGVLVARFGEVALAGHHIALTLASLSFMAGVGLAVGATTRVGMHVGAGRSDDARRVGFLAIAMGAIVLGAGAVLFVAVPAELAALFAPNDPDVVAMGASLLRIAAVFAISDGVQVVAAGALRGAGDTRWPFFANAVGHWAIGVPTALWLGFGLEMGAQGFWWALTLGLTLVAIVLTTRFWVLSKRPLARV